MERNFEKHGVAHYMAPYILSSSCGIANLIQFLKNKHPEILDEVMSEFRISEHTVQYTLNHITKCLENIGEITRAADKLIEEKFKNSQKHEN